MLAILFNLQKNPYFFNMHQANWFRTWEKYVKITEFAFILQILPAYVIVDKLHVYITNNQPEIT